MARLFWLTVMAAFVAALLAGASWAAALMAVGTLLGAPPPEMGTQSSTFLWQGAPQLAGHPRVGGFSFGATGIPGAPPVRIYFTPLRPVAGTEAADLAGR